MKLSFKITEWERLQMGLYTFNLTNEEGEVEEVKARFTYVFKEEDGTWKISTHHSSVDPGFEVD